MRIVLDIDDATVPSIEQYIATQVRVEHDQVTGAQKHVRLYADPQALIEDAVFQVVHQCVRQYPSDLVREKMAAERKLQEEIRGHARPTRVK